MKKWLLVIATAVGASVLKKNLDRTQSDKKLWAEATGSTTPAAPAGPSADAWATATDSPSAN